MYKYNQITVSSYNTVGTSIGGSIIICTSIGITLRG